LSVKRRLVVKLEQFINEAVANGGESNGGESNAWWETLFSRIGVVSLTDEIKVLTPKNSADWAPEFSEMEEYNDTITVDAIPVPTTGLVFVTESDQSDAIYKDGIKRIEMTTSYGGLEILIDGNFVEDNLE
jgi:hypothetical protein